MTLSPRNAPDKINLGTRKTIDGLAAGLMITVCMVWGFQQVALKATAPDVSPLLQIALRSGIAALLVGLLMFGRGGRMSLRDGMWRPGMLVGLLFALEFLLVGDGLRHTSASRMVVFLYTAPIFAALGLHRRLPAERLQALQWAGIALAFSGIVMAFFGRHQSLPAGTASNMLWGDFLGLLAGMAWGATTVAVRCSRLASLPATQTLLYQLVGAFVLLLLAATGLGQTAFRPTPLAWSNLAFQALVVSFASFLVWFWLLWHYLASQLGVFSWHYLASQLGVFSFLTPLFGVVFGIWILDEPLEAGFLGGAPLVLAGIVLVSGYGWLKQMARNMTQSQAPTDKRRTPNE